MAQYTIRGLDSKIEQEILRMAKQQGKSINQVLKELIHKELQGPPSPPASSLRQLAGGWSREEAAAFERAIRTCEQIDEEMWR
jgi:hypothetical protein